MINIAIKETQKSNEIFFYMHTRIYKLKSDANEWIIKWRSRHLMWYLKIVNELQIDQQQQLQLQLQLQVQLANTKFVCKTIYLQMNKQFM